MLTWILIFFLLNRRYSIILGFTDSLFTIIHEKISIMQDTIEEKADEVISGEKDRYIWVSSA